MLSVDLLAATSCEAVIAQLSGMLSQCDGQEVGPRCRIRTRTREAGSYPGSNFLQRLLFLWA